jgi:hypothetical protein
MNNKRPGINPLDRILVALPAILTAIASVVDIQTFCNDRAVELLAITLAWSVSLQEAATQVGNRRIENALDPNDPEGD